MKISHGEYQAICDRYKSGETQKAIGETYGVSNIRIGQILNAHGITAKDSPTIKEKSIKKKQKREMFDNTIRPALGVTNKQAREFRQNNKDAYYNYRHHKRNAQRHRIEFNITLHEYWDLWEKSGKWQQRGKSANSYVFTRIDHSKPFTVDNCQIITLKESSKNTQEREKEKRKS